MIRTSSHVITSFVDNATYIISSSSKRSDTVAVQVESKTGGLLFKGLRGIDLFGSENEAIDVLSRVHGEVRRMIRGFAVIGAAVFHQWVVIPLVTRIARTELFGGHTCCEVKEIQWVKIRLTFPLSTAQFSDDQRLLEALLGFALDGTHYYSETMEMTSRFPGALRDPEFRWNTHLAAPFDRLGLEAIPVALVQGLVRVKRVESDVTSSTFLAFLSRKSVLNPGTRYHSRGLNSRGGCGNEMECEVVMWTESSAEPGEALFASYVWRRGTVPIWWTSDLVNATDRELEIVVRPHAPFEGAERYYGSLVRRYGPVPVTCINLLRAPPSAEAGLSEAFQESLKHVKAKLDLRVAIVNLDWHGGLKANGLDAHVETLWALVAPFLLDFGMTTGRLVLTDHFSDTTPPYPLEPKRLSVTLHQEQKGILRINCADSLDRTNLAAFFISIQVVAEAHRVLVAAAAAKSSRRGKNNAPSEAMPSSAPPTTTTTNVTSTPTTSEPPPPSQTQTQEPQPARQQSSKHSAANTTTAEVPLDFPLLDLTLADLKVHYETVCPTLLDALVGFTLENGDIASLLYTSSPATHSNPIRNMASVSYGAAPSDIVVSMTRRFHNYFNDATRQVSFEVFLGLKGHLQGTARVPKLLPSYPIATVPVASSTLQDSHLLDLHDTGSMWDEGTSAGTGSLADGVLGAAASLIPVLGSSSSSSPFSSPSTQNNNNNHHSSSSGSANNNLASSLAGQAPLQYQVWPCPVGCDHAEVFAYLSRPAYLSHIALVLRHAGDEFTLPRTVDVYCGATLESMGLVLMDVVIPRAADGTVIVLRVPDREDRVHAPTPLVGPVVYDFEGGGGGGGFSGMEGSGGAGGVAATEDADAVHRGGALGPMLTRVVRVVFRARAGGPPMTLGPIEFYGGTVLPDPSPAAVRARFEEEAALTKLENIQRIVGLADGVLSVDSARRLKTVSELEEEGILEEAAGEVDNAGRVVTVSSSNSSDHSASPTASPEGNSKKPAKRYEEGAVEEGEVERQRVQQQPPPPPMQQQQQQQQDDDDDEEEEEVDDDQHAQSSSSAPPASLRDRAESTIATTSFQTLPPIIEDYFPRPEHQPSSSGPQLRAAEAGGSGLAGLGSYPAGHSLLFAGANSGDDDGGSSALSEYRAFIEAKLLAAGVDDTAIADSAAGSGVKLTFLDTLEVERARIVRRIGASDRNRLLAEMRVNARLFDPNRFISQHDEKCESAMRKTFKSSTCRWSQGAGCKQSLLFGRSNSCHYCRQKFCTAHMAPAKRPILEFGWKEPHPVCRACHDVLTAQDEALAAIHAMLRVQDAERASEATVEARRLLRDAQLASISCLMAGPTSDGLFSVALFPDAGLLTAVPTARGSAPPESLLYPPGLQLGPAAQGTSWAAPAGLRQVELLVVLATNAYLYAVELDAGSDRGWSAADVPHAHLSTGLLLPNLEDRGEWMITPRPGSTSVRYEFTTPVQARILRLVLSLPSSDPKQGDEQRGAAADERQIHADRLRVYGIPEAKVPIVKASRQRAPTSEAVLSVQPRAPAGSRQPLRPSFCKLSRENKIMHVGFDRITEICGFTIPYAVEVDLVTPAAYKVRVSVLISEAKNSTFSSHEVVGEFLVPEAKTPGQGLFFDFPRPYKGNLVILENLAGFRPASATERPSAFPKASLF